MTTVYIPPGCGRHEGSTVVKDGEVTHTTCPTLLSELETLRVYPDADVSLCAVAVMEILKGWGSYYTGLRRTCTGPSFKGLSMHVTTPWTAEGFEIQADKVFVTFFDKHTEMPL